MGSQCLQGLQTEPTHHYCCRCQPTTTCKEHGRNEDYQSALPLVLLTNRNLRDEHVFGRPGAMGYGTLIEPFAIHPPPGFRMRNATSVALQPAVDELNEPENSALP
jgi:hypothetical protein